MSAAPMTDAGAWCFPPETTEFLTELRANNDRSWFAAQAQRYEMAIKRPAAELCDILSARLHTLTGRRHVADIFRIQRDLRFSKDKRPYHAHLHIAFKPDGKSDAAATFMLGVDPDGLCVGAGVITFSKAQLAAYRNRASGGEGDSLAELLARCRHQGARIDAPELSRPPRGYAFTTRNGELLRRKSLTAWIDRAPDTIASRGFIERCLVDCERVKPIYDWLTGLNC